MLLPELTLLAAASALIITLINSLVMVAARRRDAKALSDLRTELDATLSASQGLARHVRNIEQLKPRAETAGERNDKTSVQSMGLSESEAEIVTHLKPLRALRSKGISGVA